MIMRRKFGRYSPALLLLLFGCLSSIDQQRVIAQEAGDQQDVVVFSVSSSGPAEHFMEPVLIIDEGRYANPIAGDSDAAALKEFAAKYYGAGKNYRLLFGGGQAGFVTVEKPTMDSECFRTGASIKLTAQVKVKLNRNVMALATNLRGQVREQSSRRVPTSTERTEAIRLAKQAYKEKGTPAVILPTLEVVNLTAVDLNGDGKAELIGTFVLKKNKGGAARYVLFLIAESEGKGYRAALTNYERFISKDIMSGGSLDSIGAEGIYTERLVDILNLDIDSAAEVFTITNSFEGVTYKLYKKQAGMWKSVYEFNSYRCGF